MKFGPLVLIVMASASLAGVSAEADVLLIGADVTSPIFGPNRVDIMKSRVINGAALGGFNFGNVDTWDAKSTIPSLATMENYSAVIVWSNNAFADVTALGNNLADFVDQGHGVLLMSFGSSFGPEGRWGTGGYDPLLNGGYVGDIAGSMSSFVATDPLFTGVSTVNGEYIQSGIVRPGATLLASWNVSTNSVDAAPMAIEANGFAGQVINLNFYGAYPYPNTNGDIDRLIGNAINELSTSPSVSTPLPSTFIMSSILIAAFGTVSLYKRQRCVGLH